MRRIGLPVSYSEGFSPRAKLHFGLALSTGHESLAEYVDVDLDADPGEVDSAPDIEALPALLTPALPRRDRHDGRGGDPCRDAVAPAGRHELQLAHPRGRCGAGRRRTRHRPGDGG